MKLVVLTAFIIEIKAQSRAIPKSFVILFNTVKVI